MTITKTGSRIIGTGKHSLRHRVGLELTSPMIGGLGVGVGLASGQMSLGGAAGAFGVGISGFLGAERAMKRFPLYRGQMVKHRQRQRAFRKVPGSKLGKLPRRAALLLRRSPVAILPLLSGILGWELFGSMGEKVLDKVMPIWKRKGTEKVV